jgi:WD40 repeat protein
VAACNHPEQPCRPEAKGSAEGRLERFEDAWQRGARPALEEHVPEGGPSRLAVLADLIHIDLEYRLKAGEPARVETYLERYPELAGDRGFVAGLIAAELGLRRRLEPALAPAEYLGRFPAYREELLALLGGGPGATPEAGPATPADTDPGATVYPEGRERPAPRGPAAAVPGYELLEPLGRGGMGVVYRAVQLRLKRTVALKMILDGAWAGPEELARFRAEAEAVARLQHPHIVAVHEVGEHGGLPFFSMELVDGGSLDRHLRGRQLAAPEAAGLVEKLARAMHAAHEKGVVHRDLKPANVLLTASGEPRVTDFGLAKRLDASHARTQTGQVLGTPSYMAPEQAAGKARAVGPATDVWGLGAILYECLAGVPPFRGETPLATLELVKNQEPVPPSRLRKVPRDLETVCLKCLRKDPAQRYASALGLADDLRRFLDDRPFLARPPTPGESLRRWVRRHKGLAASAAAVTLGLVLALAAGLVLYGHSRRTSALEAVARAFEGRLERDDCSPEALGQAEALLDEMSALDPEQARASRRRWYQHVEAVLRQAMTGERFTALEGERVAQALGRLKGYQPRLAAELGRSLRKSLGEWTTVLDLAPPFRGLESAFDTEEVRRAPGAPAALVPARPTRPDRGDPVPTRATCEGDVRLEAVWAAPWWGAASEVGLGLDDTQGHRDPPQCLAFTRDGKCLVSASSGGEVKWWSLPDGRHLATRREYAASVTDLAVSPDGKLLASAGRDGTVRLWDPASRKATATLAGHAGAVQAVAFSPDGSLLASAAADGSVRLWDGRTGKPSGVLADHEGGATLVAFRPGGELVSCDGAGLVRVWDVAARTCKKSFRAEQSPLYRAALSPDGQSLATAATDGAVRLRDLATGGELASLQRHQGRVLCLAFSPDGRFLAVGSDRGDPLLWEPGTRAAPAPLGGHHGPVPAVAFAPGGKSLATAGADGGIHLRDPGTGRQRVVLRPQRYAFLVSAGPPTGSLAAAVRQTGELRIRILRNGSVLADERAAAPAALADGPLRLSATAEGGRLTFRVNDLPPVTFQDAFPLPEGAGVFSLRWPAEARLERLRAWRKLPAGESRPLERGDRLYAQGRWAEALACYQALPDSQEARCKAALCLLEQDPRGEAAGEPLKRVAAEQGQRWPPMAEFYLWLLRLRQKRADEANALLKQLTSRYRFEDLAPFVPESARREVLGEYERQRAYELTFRPRSPEPLELLLLVQGLFRAPQENVQQTRHRLVQVLHESGRVREALSRAESLLREPLAGSLRRQVLWDYAWLCLRVGEPGRALQEVERWRARPGGDLDLAAHLLPHRAVLRARLGLRKEAREDLEAYRRLVPADYHNFFATLLCGFLLQGGSPAAAQEVWRQGYRRRVRQGWARHDLGTVMLGSLGDDVTEDDTARMVASVLERGLPYFPQLRVLANGAFSAAELAPVLRGMWRGPRGREYARQLAFLELPYAEWNRAPARLFIYEICNQAALGGKPTPEQDELAWKVACDLHARYAAGSLDVGRLVAVYTAWKMPASYINLGFLKYQLEPSIRGPGAYLSGLRYLRGERPSAATAERLFRVALDNAPPNSTLARLAQAEIDRLKARPRAAGR